MWLLVLGSLFGPALFALTGKPYYVVVAWAAISTAFGMWRDRDILAAAQRDGGFDGATSGTRFVTLLLFIALAVVATALHSAVYFGIRALS